LVTLVAENTEYTN